MLQLLLVTTCLTLNTLNPLLNALILLMNVLNGDACAVLLQQLRFLRFVDVWILLGNQVDELLTDQLMSIPHTLLTLMLITLLHSTWHVGMTFLVLTGWQLLAM